VTSSITVVNCGVYSTAATWVPSLYAGGTVVGPDPAVVTFTTTTGWIDPPDNLGGVREPRRPVAPDAPGAVSLAVPE
jgi:hypothetical protein